MTLNSGLLLLASGTAHLGTFEVIVRNGLLQSADPFASTAPVPPLTEHKVTLPFNDGSTLQVQPEFDSFYTYEGGVLRLHVSADTKSDIANIEKDLSTPLTYWREFSVYSRLSPSGSYIGQNGFGARARVQRYNRRTVAVAYNFGRESSYWTREVNIPLPGPEARKLLQLAAVEVTFSPEENFQATPECKHLLIEATPSRPIEVDDLRCVIRAKISTIRIIRTDTGDELTTP